MPNYRILTILSGQEKLPWNYHELVQGWLYKCIKGTPLGDKTHAAKYSLFNYCLTALEPIAEKESLSSGNGLWMLRITSASDELLNLFLTNIKKQKIVILGEAKLTLNMVVQEQFSTSELLMAEPILVFGKDKRMLDAHETEFAEAVTNSLKKKWEYYFGTEMPPVQFSFTEPPKRKLVQYKERLLLSFQGEVYLQTKKEVINFAQCVGLGNKPSCGFGMVA